MTSMSRENIDKLFAGANGGDAEAQHEIGEMFALGDGLPENHKEADYWFKQSIENGLAEANASRGKMHAETGNYAEAISQWEEGAYKGDITCQYALAMAFSQGVGVDKNLVIAYAWINLATAQYDWGAGPGNHYLWAKSKIVAEMVPAQITVGQSLSMEYWMKIHEDLPSVSLKATVDTAIQAA